MAGIQTTNTLKVLQLCSGCVVKKRKKISLLPYIRWQKIPHQDTFLPIDKILCRVDLLVSYKSDDSSQTLLNKSFMILFFTSYFTS